MNRHKFPSIRQTQRQPGREGQAVIIRGPISQCAFPDAAERLTLRLWHGAGEQFGRVEAQYARDAQAAAPCDATGDCFAEPGRNGFGWLSCGAQPDSQITSKVARMRPSGSAKRLV